MDTTTQNKRICLLAACLLVLEAAAVRADVVELLNGSKLEGTVVEKDDRSVTLRVVIDRRTFTRKYPLDRVHAITVGDQRTVLHARPDEPQAKSRSGGRPDQATVGQSRTRAEVEALIEEQGRTQPDWWESVPLDYPRTLDLSWPDRPPPNWDNQRNVGQYVWDIINHNPGKWREGVRLMHHLLYMHKDDPQKRYRAMTEMARMYQDLLQDYPRAAYWWLKAGVGGEQDQSWHGIKLAECYWRLGSKKMALEVIERAPVQFATIKTLADMGETKQALAIAEANLGGPSADVALVYAGDACRVVGDHAGAVKYYERLLSLQAYGRAQRRIERNQQRARENLEAIRLFDTLDIGRVADGTYRSSSMGFEAPVHVEVAVKAGKIESVRVTEHREKQFYSALTDTPRKIIAKQGVQGIDTTSSATITSEAIINATAKALAGGMR